MNGNDDAFMMACFGEDVVAAFDTIECPPGLLYSLGKIVAGHLLQTTNSNMRSLVLMGLVSCPTSIHSSIASIKFA